MTLSGNKLRLPTLLDELTHWDAVSVSFAIYAPNRFQFGLL